MLRRDFLLAAAGAVIPAKQDLWTAGEGGYALYRIPGIVVTAKGTPLTYCEARKSARGDWGSSDIMFRRGSEPTRVIGKLDGAIEKNPVALVQNLGTPGDITYGNPTAIAGRDGTVHFLYCVEYMRAFYMQSRDDGRTFTTPREITTTFESYRPGYPWKVLAIGPGHGIQLRNGRLLASVWMSTGTGGHAHRPSVAATIWSDDHGATWHAGAIAVPHTDDWPNPSEATLVELTDGRVMLNVRTESARKRRLVLTSQDGASNWSHPEFDDTLVDPVCFGSLVRAGKSVYFVNPDDPKARRNLTLRRSTDNGESWSTAAIIDSGKAGYADIAVLPKGDILCLYERNAEALTLIRTL